MGRVAERQSSDGAMHQWGPVCRGYQVLLPDGGRGSVEDIRLGDDGVELTVGTGLFVHRQLTIREAEIDVILPAAHRIVVRSAKGAGTPSGVDDLEAAGGILRMPVLHSLRPSFPEDAG
jgi:hypothetical protein